MVPACDFPASFDAFVAGFEAQEVEDKTSDGDEIMCGVIFSHSASVFVKGDVEDPVAAVFNSPMLPRAAELMRGVAVVAGDVIMIFDRGFLVARLFTADANDLMKIGPLVTIHPWSTNRTSPSSTYFVSSTSIL